MRRLEPALYLVVLAVLAGALFVEGRRHTALQAQVALTPAQLWTRLSRSQTTLQIVDARPALDDYEDTHIPGALPFPGCDPARTPPEAQDRLYPYVATVIVTGDGDEDTYRRCARHFTLAWNLRGGLEAWSDASLPEDSGEFVPPRVSAGGGCL